MTRFLSALIVMGLLVCAPLMAGTWSANGIRVCEIVAGVAFAVWLGGVLAQRRLPKVHVCLLLCVASLLAQGWWMALNPGADSVLAIPSWAKLVSSIEPLVYREEMLRVSSVLAVLVIVCDLARSASVRMALWIGSAVAGCSVAVLGIGQRFNWFADSLRAMRPEEGTPFATFNYHGNAGAFLNLVIPAVFGLACAAWRKRDRPWLRGITALCLLLVLIAAVINVSRGAIAITAVMGVAFTLWIARDFVRGGVAFSWGRLAAMTLLGALALVLVSHFANGGTSLQRWKQMVKQPTGEVARRMVWGITLPMAAEAGPFGSGPGTFKVLLPKSPRLGPGFYEKWIVQTHEPGGRISMWSQAHEDYLQTVVEWGWLGGAVWAAILGGGLLRLMSSRKNHREPHSIAERTAVFCTGVAITGVCIHAAFDFPLQIFPLQLHAAMWLGLAWSSPEWEAPPEAATDTNFQN